jgi:hypothetical protein
LGIVVADVSYYPGNSCDSLVDSLRSGCNNIPALVVRLLVSGDAEGDDDLSLLRTQKGVVVTAPG